MTSWHRSYRGQSVGRVFHFLYHYCGFDVAELATIGKGSVVYQGRKIATYVFPNDSDDIPIFTFLGYDPATDDNRFYPSRETIEENQKLWTENQRSKLLDAILDQEPAKQEPCRECRSLRLELSIYKHGVSDGESRKRG